MIRGTSDPFAEVKVGNETQTTDVIDKTLTPLWNAHFTFSVYAPKTNLGKNILITVWDKVPVS